MSSQNDQKRLGTFATESTIDTTDNPDKTPFEIGLANAGISPRKINILAAEFDSITELLNSPDENILDQNRIGDRTVEKIRSTLNLTYNKGYSVDESDGEVTVEEWAEDTEGRKTILTGEYILSKLIQSDEFGHHSQVSRELTDWAHNVRRGNIQDADESDIGLIYDLTPYEINTQTLFDTGNTYNSIEDVEAERQEAVEQANALITFCETTDRYTILKDAKEKARDKIQTEQEERLEREQKQQQVRELLENPKEEIAGWQYLNTPIEDVYAYAGTFQDDNLKIVGLFEHDGYVRVRLITIESWNNIEWESSNITKQLYEDSSATGKTPETLSEGMQDLKRFLEYNECSRDEVKTNVITEVTLPNR